MAPTATDEVKGVPPGLTAEPLQQTATKPQVADGVRGVPPGLTAEPITPTAAPSSATHPNSQYAKPGPYRTDLAPSEEQEFQQWVKQNNIPWQDEPTADYDMRGYWRAWKQGRVKQDEKTRHFPDTWKTPYHESFSNESQYALPTAPRWNKKRQLVDASGKVVYQEGQPQVKGVPEGLTAHQIETPRMTQFLAAARSAPLTSEQPEPAAAPQPTKWERFHKILSNIPVGYGNTAADLSDDIAKIARQTHELLSNPVMMTDEQHARFKQKQDEFVDNHLQPLLEKLSATTPALAPLADLEKTAFGRGATRGGSELAESFTSPYQVALMIGTFGESALTQVAAKTGIKGAVPVARTLAKLIQAEFITQMERGFSEGAAQTWEAARNGDWETAGKAAVESLASGLMGFGLMSHETAVDRTRMDLERTARAKYGEPEVSPFAQPVFSRFDQLDPYRQAAVVHDLVQGSPEYRAVIEGVEAKDEKAKAKAEKDNARKLADFTQEALNKTWSPKSATRAFRWIDESKREFGRAVSEKRIKDAYRDHYLKQIAEQAALEKEFREAEEERRTIGREARPEKRAEAAKSREEARKVTLATAEQISTAREEKTTARTTYERELSDHARKAEEQRAAGAEAARVQRMPDEVTDDRGYVSYRGRVVGGEEHFFGPAQTPDKQWGVYRQTPDGTEFLGAGGIYEAEPEEPFIAPNERTAKTLAQINSLRVNADFDLEENGSTPEREIERKMLRDLERQLVGGDVTAEEARKAAGLPEEKIPLEHEKPTASQEIEAAQSGALNGPLHQQSRAEFESAFRAEAEGAGWTPEDVDAQIATFPLAWRMEAENNLHYVGRSGDWIASKKGVTWVLDSKGMLRPEDGSSAPIPLMKNGRYTQQAIDLSMSGRVGFGYRTWEIAEKEVAQQREADRQLENLTDKVAEELQFAIEMGKQNAGLMLLPGEPEKAAAPKQKRAFTPPPEQMDMFDPEREYAAFVGGIRGERRAAQDAENSLFIRAIGDYIGEHHEDAWGLLTRVAKNSGMSPQEVLRLQMERAAPTDTLEGKIANLKVGDTVSDKMRLPWAVEKDARGNLYLRSGDSQRVPLNPFNPSDTVRRIVGAGEVMKAPGPRYTLADVQRAAYEAPYITKRQRSIEDVQARANGEVNDPEPITPGQAEAQAAAAQERASDVKGAAIVDAVKAADPPPGTSLEDAHAAVDKAEETKQTAEQAEWQKIQAASKTFSDRPFAPRAPVSMGERYVGNPVNIKHLGQSYGAKYAVVPLDSLVNSHIWEGNTLVINPDYDEALQPRTISEGRSSELVLEAQLRQSDSAKGYDFDYYGDRTIGPLTGPAIIEQGGRVAGGNTRIAIMRKHLEMIREISDPELKEIELQNFRMKMNRLARESGIQSVPNDGRDYVVVRMLDEPITTQRDAALKGMVFNSSPSNEITEAAKGVALARQMSEETLVDIGRMLDEHDTLGAAISANPQVFTDIVRDQLGVASTEDARWFTEGPKGKVLSEEGRRKFAQVLMGRVFQDTSVLEALQGTPAYTAIERASINIIRMKATRNEPMVEKIVEAVHAAKTTWNTGIAGEGVADRWEATYDPKATTFDFAAFDIPPMPDKVVEAIWRSIHSGPRTLSDRVKAYNETDRPSRGDRLMFDTDAHKLETPAELFNRVFKKEIKEVNYFREKKREDSITEAEYNAALENRGNLSDQEVKEAERVEQGLPPEERRKSEMSALRKRIDAMTPEEKNRAIEQLHEKLHTDELTGLPNKAAFDAAEGQAKAAVIGVSDMAGLKAFNDEYGQAAGDKALKAMGEALKRAGLDAYRIHGDEIAYRADSEEELRAKLEEAREILRNTGIAVEKAGIHNIFTGVDISYGMGKDYAEADRAMSEAKKARKTKRGEFGDIKPVGKMEPPPKKGEAPGQAILDIKQEEQRLLAEGVRAFASGVNRVPDLEGFVKAGVPIGVDVSSLTPDMIARIKQLNAPVFVDSGAFSEMEFGPEGPKVAKAITDEEWSRRLEIYKDLAKSLGDKATVVAPDMVGSQKVTLERLKKFSKQLQELKDLGARIVVPLQRGEETNFEDTGLDELWMEANRAAGFDIETPGGPEVTRDFSEGIDHSKGMIPGFPLKKAALSPSDVLFFTRLFKPPSIHLLGMGASNRIADPLIRMLHEENPGMEITMDSNVLRAHVGEGRAVTKAEAAGTSRAEAIAGTFAGRKIGGQVEPSLDVAKSEKGYISPEDLRVFLESHPSTKDNAPEIMRTARMMADYVYDLDPPEGVEKRDALGWILRERLAGLEASEDARKAGSFRTAKGEERFGKGILALHKAANPTTFLHEFAHVVFPLLSEEDMKAIDTLQGRTKSDGKPMFPKWDGKRGSLTGDVFTGVSEKFAGGMERFLRDQNPTGFKAEVKMVLDKIKAMFVKFYNTVAGDPLSDFAITTSTEAKRVYAEMFGITDFDAPDDFRKNRDAARKEEARQKKGMVKPDEAKHPVQAVASEFGAVGIRDAMDGAVVESIGTRVDPSKPNVTLFYPGIEQAAAAWMKVGDMGAGVQNAELIKGEGESYGIRFNVEKPVPKTVLYQDVPQRHPGLELQDLEAKLAKTPESTPMLRKFLETRIGQLKAQIRSQYGVDSPKFGPNPELAKKALSEVKRGTAATEGARPAVSDIRAVPHGTAGDVQKGTGRLSRPPVMGMPGHAGAARAADRPGSRVPTNLANVKPVTLVPFQRERGAPVGILSGQAFDEKAWRDGLKRAGLPETLPPPTVTLSPEVAQVLKFAGQKQIVQTVLSALEQGDGAVLASATGTGKTYTGGAIAKETLLKNPNAKILLITKNRGLLKTAAKTWKDSYGMDMQVDAPSAEKMDKNVYGASYQRLLNNPIYKDTHWDLVLADESGEARNWYLDENQQGKLLMAVMDNASKGVYISATPFHSPNEFGYLEKLNLWPKGQFQDWIKNNFAHEKIGDRIVAKLDPAKQAKFREQLIERGQMMSQEISYHGFTVHFGVVPVDDVIERKLDRIHQGIAVARRELLAQGKKGLAERIAAFEATYTKAFLERSRIPQAIELAKKAKDAGWHPIIFSETTSEDLFRRPLKPGEEMGTYRKLDEESGGMIGRIMPEFPNIMDELRSAFGDDIGDYSGLENTDAQREENKANYLKGEKPMLYTSYAAGGIGVSLHDEDGDKPRFSIFLGPPYSGVLLEQSMGRTWRFGVKSNAMAVFLATDSEPDIRLMATKVGPRMRALRASVLGERDSLAAVMSNYTDEQKMREMQDLLAFDQGNEVKVDAQNFQVRSKRKVNFDNWASITVPSAEEAKNKGMQVEMSGGGKGDDWTTLYQEKPKRWEPPNRPLTIEDLKIRRAINKAADEAANNPSIPAGEIAMAAARAEDVAKNAPEEVDKEAAARDEVYAHLKGISLRQENETGTWKTAETLEPGVSPRESEKPYTGASGLVSSQEQNLLYMDKKLNMPGVGRELVTRGRRYDAMIMRQHADLRTQFSGIMREAGLNPHDSRVMRDIWDVVRGKRTVADPYINRAAVGVRRMMAEIHQKGAAGNLSVVTPDGRMIKWSDFSDDPSYMPAIADWDAKFSDGQNTYTLREIMGESFDEAKARQLMERKLRENKDSDWTGDTAYLAVKRVRLKAPKQGNINFTNEVNFPFIKKDYWALDNYFKQFSKAMALESEFGSELQKLNQLIAKIPNQQARTDVESMFGYVFTPQNWDRDLGKIYNAAAGFESMTKMTFSATKVLFHAFNSPLVLGGKSMPLVKALFHTIGHPKEVMHNAYYIGTVMRGVDPAVMYLPETKVQKFAFKATGFEYIYNLGRGIAGESARVYMDQYALKMFRDGGTKAAEARRTLKNSFLMGDAAIDKAVETGKWTDEDYKLGQVAFTNESLYADNPLQMPGLARRRISGSNLGSQERYINMALRASYSLQSFSVKTYSMLREHLWDEVVQHHNYKPLAFAIAVAPVLGTALQGVGAGVKGFVHRGLEKGFNKPHSDDSWDKFIARFTALGGDHKAAAILMLVLDGICSQWAFEKTKKISDALMNYAMDNRKAVAAYGRYGWMDDVEEALGPIWSDAFRPLRFSYEEWEALGGKPENFWKRTEKNILRQAEEVVPIFRQVPQVEEEVSPGQRSTGSIYAPPSQ